MILPIYLDPKPVLTRKTQPLTAEQILSSQIHTLIDDMIDTMKNAEGIGLAAPQVGSDVSVAIVGVGDLMESDVDILELINPVITKSSHETSIAEEGCLSIPGIYGTVKRPTSITVEYIDRNGNKKIMDATNMVARVIQHEIDHLNGILFTTKAIEYSREERIIPKYPHL